MPISPRADADPNCPDSPNALFNGLAFSVSKNNDSAEQWPTTYGFVVDRLRAVRQDLIVQELAPDETSRLLEAMIPYYLDAEIRCRSGHGHSCCF